MKYLLVLLVVVVGLWLLLRSRGTPPADPGSGRGGRGGRDGDKAEPVVACAHCGLHLPRHDAIVDGSGRPFCSDAHRLAGPR